MNKPDALLLLNTMTINKGVPYDRVKNADFKRKHNILFNTRFPLQLYQSYSEADYETKKMVFT